VFSKGKDNGGAVRIHINDLISVRFPNSSRDAQFRVVDYIKDNDEAILVNVYTNQKRQLTREWLEELNATNYSEIYGDV
jgi:hypothetical protein